MASQSLMSLSEDGVAEAVLSPPITPSTPSSSPQDFRAVFEHHMPSSKKPIKHESTSVLLLSYDSTNKANMDVHDEIQALHNVLEKDYGFYVKQEVIRNDRKPQIQMDKHLIDFTWEHGKNHALLIIYYAGHGWHSSTRSRDHPGSFDLYSQELEVDAEPSEREMIMWERCETILHGVEGDVLVVFDCCDAGSLAALRSVGRSFEYLGACEKGKYTHRPSEKSFTSALTWALKELRSKPSFTSEDLRVKIRAHKSFPKTQNPILVPRSGYMPEHVWISKMGDNPSPKITRQRSVSAPEFRDEDCDFVDFRVIFNRHLADEDGKIVAEMMRPLVGDRKLPLNARHVSIVRKGVCRPPRSPLELWSRARHHITAVQRFLGPGKISKLSATKKRDRYLFESDAEDSHARKRSKSSVSLEVGDSEQCPITPSSEGPESGIPSLRVNTALEPVIGENFSSQTESLLIDLEKLKQSALQDPQLQRVLHSQIRAMLEDTERTVGFH